MKILGEILNNIMLYIVAWLGVIVAIPLIVLLTIINPVATCKGLSAFAQGYKDHINKVWCNNDKNI